MPLRVKVDEDLPEDVAAVFAEAGYAVATVLIRADNESRRSYLDLAGVALHSFRLEDFLGCLIVVTPRGIRIRDWR